MKLAYKIPLIVGLLLFLSAGTAGVSLLRVHGVVQVYDGVVDVSREQERLINLALIDFKTQVQEWKNVLLRGKDEERRDKYWVAFQKREGQVRASIDGLMETLPAGEARELVDRFRLSHQQMGAGYRGGFSAFEAAGHEAPAGDAAVAGMDREPARLLGEAAKAVALDSHSTVMAARERYKRVLRDGVIAMSVVALLGLLGAAWLTRSILRGLGADPALARELVHKIAAGDLMTPIRLRPDDDSSLLAAMASMQSDMVGTMSHVRSSSDAIVSGSGRIAREGGSIRQRMQQLGASLEQTSASMAELDSTVQRNADNAQEANRLALDATEVASRGGSVVSEVVETMRGINAGSNEISDIIGVIDGIAFQTNLLALNAAVEAARAGEQGRGFAVVASEVRALAHRSADAASQIKSLITASVERVEQGTHLVDQAGTTMDDVVGSISRVSAIVAQISTASQEQSQAVQHVGEAITRIDGAMLESSNMVEHSASAAQDLLDQAQTMVTAVARFRLEAGDASGRGPALERTAA